MLLLLVLGQVGPAGAAMPRLSAAVLQVSGGLEVADVRTALQRRSGAMRACFEARLKVKPRLGGELIIPLRIGRSGRAAPGRAVSSTVSDPSARRCVRRVLKRLRFPRARRDTRARVAIYFGSARPRVVDVSAAWTAYWKAANGLGPRERLTRFRADVSPAFDEYYQWMLGKWGDNAATNLSVHVDRFAELKPRYEAAAAFVRRDLQGHIDRFRARFPELPSELQVTVLHSLGELDGGMRTFAGRSWFLLGLDNIARFHNFDDQAAFFHHELFHVLHDRLAPNKRVMWSALWAEGLAVWVSRLMNPDASNAELLLDLPPGLVAEVDKRLKPLATRFLRVINSKAPEVYGRWFLMGSKDASLPKRAGYVLGLRVVEVVARDVPLDDLIRLRGRKLRTRIRAALKGLR